MPLSTCEGREGGRGTPVNGSSHYRLQKRNADRQAGSCTLLMLGAMQAVLWPLLQHATGLGPGAAEADTLVEEALRLLQVCHISTTTGTSVWSVSPVAQSMCLLSGVLSPYVRH